MLATNLTWAQGANEPLSAIDWLSDSVTLSPGLPEAQKESLGGAPVRDVTVAPLTDDATRQVGLRDPVSIRLPNDLWGANSAAELTTMLGRIQPGRHHQVREFLVDLVTTRFEAPVDSISDNSFLLARVDALLNLGRLDLAEQMLAAADASDPDFFRRTFDIALLQGTEAAACDAIQENPDISPTFPARIFCLARNGEWDVAALTLGTAEALGILSPEEDALLLRFLDPDLFEGDPVPPPPDQVSPLLFRLYEAVGERISTDALPVAFAHSDISATVGWKTRLHAAERLAVAGAISSDTFSQVLSERKPAASGGVWTRVEGLQCLMTSLEAGDSTAVSQKLPTVWNSAVDMGYGPVLADLILPDLNRLDLTEKAKATAFEIALTNWNLVSAKKWVPAGRSERSLLAVAEGRPFAMAVSSALDQSIQRALVGARPSDRYAFDIEDNRRGAALLNSLSVLALGSDGDPAALGDALTVLMSLGLDDGARRIAVDILLEASRI
ncbi:MAG: hypothetical protein OXQ30_01255 [Boseongicola sp.]|nr:hypothetical protein [Boseongicola sp.]